MSGPEEQLKQAITSFLEIQNKLTTCSSAVQFQHLTDDVPLSNTQKDDEVSVKRKYVLFRTARDMGANMGCLNFLAEADEMLNLTRGRNGFQNKMLRSNIQQTSQTTKDESQGGWLSGFRRNKDGA